MKHRNCYGTTTLIPDRLTIISFPAWIPVILFAFRTNDVIAALVQVFRKQKDGARPRKSKISVLKITSSELNTGVDLSIYISIYLYETLVSYSNKQVTETDFFLPREFPILNSEWRYCDPNLFYVIQNNWHLYWHS